jgi:hypothetical protein
VLVRFDQLEEFLLRTAHACGLPATRFSQLTTLAADYRETLEQAEISYYPGTVDLDTWTDLHERKWRVMAIVPLPEDGCSMAFSLWYESGELRLHLGAKGVMLGGVTKLRSGRYVCRSEALEPYDCPRDQAIAWLVGTINLYLSPDFSDIHNSDISNL